MKTEIFAEGSKTTAEDLDIPARQYYDGLFSAVDGLNAELEKFTETQLHILSKEYGVVEGNKHISNIRDNLELPVGRREMMSTAQTELRRVAATADVMVILLSTDVFQATVAQQWDKLVDEAKPGSIWCLSAARSALDEIDVTELQAKDCSVITYQRVGVAPIGSETRTELLEMVKRDINQ